MCKVTEKHNGIKKRTGEREERKAGREADNRV